MKKLIAFFALTLFSIKSFAEYGFNLTPGVTSISRDIYDLHMVIFWVCVVIAVVVFGVMFYSIYAHRKTKNPVAANFHENTKVELIWTLVPVLILIVMAIPATKLLIALEDTQSAELNIKITGHQWKWQYDYPKEGISFISNLAKSSKDSVSADKEKTSNTLYNTKTTAKGVENYLLEVDNPLVIPVDTSIRFLITSNDVIHSWWVPAFGVKQDANPGFINDAWAKIDEVGRYRGQCTELCGVDHAFMPVVVDVVSKEEYAKWVQSKKAEKSAVEASANQVWTKDDLMQRGKTKYEANCAACHKKDGSGLAGIFPAMIGSKIANGSAEEHIQIVLHGKTTMPAFKVLNDVDIAAIITYERNAFGNNGSVVQPSEVKAAR